MVNLTREGLGEVSVLVGDVMVDVLLIVADSVRSAPLPEPVRKALTRGDGDDDYVVATIHRAENTDDPVRLRAIVDALVNLRGTVILPAHPRLEARCAEHGISLDRGAIQRVAPLSYPDLVRTVMGSVGVVTDSGGLQKEAYLLRRPVTTVRTETEWTETLHDGWNQLDPVGADLGRLAFRAAPLTDPGNHYGTGKAAAQVAEALLDRHRARH